MTATIRTITRRANGRESTRTTEVPTNLLSIGRATDCEINLPDLRIGLKHARLTISVGSFLIETEGDNEFKVNGRSIRKIEAKIGAPLVALFGPYKLTFSEQAGRLWIDVERIQQAATHIGDPDRIFSLRGTWLSKRAAAWVFAVTIGLVFLAFPIATFAVKASALPSGARVEAGQLWLSGQLSGPHERLAKDCGSCHEKAFVSVRDETCLSCHHNVNHHADEARMAQARGALTFAQQGLRTVAETFNKPAGRCAECHIEHNGHTGMAPTAQSTCTGCHRDMNARLADADVANASDFGRDHSEFHPTVVAVADLREPKLTRQWSIQDLDHGRKLREKLLKPAAGVASCAGFALGQPNFRGLPHAGGASGLPAAARAGDNSGLVFPHAVHLAANGCVAAVAKRLSPADGFGEKLECKNCHTPNESGVGFQAVSMEKNCSSCHSLVFENAGGLQRELRHGRTNDVIATLLDFYQARVVGAAVGNGGADDGRRRPGEAAAQRFSGLREMAFRQAGSRAATRVRAIFAEGGACYGCHIVSPPSTPSGLDFKVAPVTLRDNFLPNGRFNHRAHEAGELKCKDCHLAETSQSSTDVLLPSIATCQSCHGGEHTEATVQSTCTKCHGFHSTLADATPMRPTGAGGSPASRKARMMAPAFRFFR